jgi:hypothetical protein
MFRRILIAGASGFLVVTVAGCGSGSGTTSASGQATTSQKATSRATSSSSTGSPQHMASSPSTSASPLDGSTLYSLLLPASAMPSGYRIDASGTRNAGQSLPQDTPQSVSAAKACQLLTGTSWIEAAGITAADFAQNDYGNSSHTAEIAQEIDYFQPGDGAKAMSQLWDVFGRCRSFSVQANGSTGKVTLTRSQLAGVGLRAVWTTPLYLGGTTLVAVRSGDAVVTVLDSSPGNDLGAEAVTLAKRITQRLQVAQQAA